MPRAKKIPTTHPFITVVIPTKNRPAELMAAMNALLTQRRKPDHIIVISSSNADNSRKESIFFKGLKGTRITFTHGNFKNISASQNEGIRLTDSRTDILVFLDDDCLPNADWILNIISLHSKHPDITAIGGGYIPYQNDYLNVFYGNECTVQKEIVNPQYFFNGNISFKMTCIRKNTLRFDERYSLGHDWEFEQQLLRLGYRVLLTRELNVLHKFRSGIFTMLKRFFEYGYAEFFVFRNMTVHYYNPVIRTSDSVISYVFHIPRMLSDSYHMYQRRIKSKLLTAAMLFTICKMTGTLLAMIDRNNGKRYP